MENLVLAPFDAQIEEIHVKVDDDVVNKQVLINIQKFQERIQKIIQYLILLILGLIKELLLKVKISNLFI